MVARVTRQLTYEFGATTEELTMLSLRPASCVGLAVLLCLLAGCRSSCYDTACVSPGTDGTVSVATAGRHVSVDLRSEITGCYRDLYDSMDGTTIGSGAHIVALDVNRIGERIYVLLQVSSSPNCNVQGRCGAGDSDEQLIWLEMTDDLNVLGRQVVALSSCAHGTYLLERKSGGDWKPISVSGVFSVESIHDKHGKNAAIGTSIRTHVEYDVAHPDRGLQIDAQEISTSD